MTRTEFDQIDWSNEFHIQFHDGEQQLFVASQGIFWNLGNNNDGVDENRPSLSCCWKKKSPSQQRFKQIEIFIDQIAAIKSLDGRIIWSAHQIVSTR